MIHEETKRVFNDLEIAVDSFDIEHSFLEQHKQKVEIQSGIYFLFDDDEIVYIGQSVDIPTRLGVHRKRFTFDSYFWCKCPENIRNVVEANLILKFKPRENNGIPPNELFKTLQQIKKWFNVMTIWPVKKFVRDHDIKQRGGYYNIVDFIKLEGLSND